MKLCLSCKTQFENSEWICNSCGHTSIQRNGRILFAPELLEGCNGFESSYFEQLAKLEASNFWFCARNNLLMWVIHKYFHNVKSFFEIGCGTGFVLSRVEKEFPHLDTFGSDIFYEGLDITAKRLSKAKLFQMDARNIPFINEFDLMGAFDVLEHIEEDTKVLGELYKATKPGGGIILTIPQHEFLWSKYDEYSHHVRRYNAVELRSKVESCGFTILKITSFVSLLLPLVYLFRMKWRNTEREYDSMSQYNIGALTNNLLEKVLNFEHAMIKTGISFPVGSSLLLVARKS